MAVTQYIGPRIAPVFADPVEWSSTKQYEPLTIVTYQGNSFTSRQFVPVGIDIDNTDFWVETGNYNAQVEAYRQETLGFVNSIQHKAFAFETVADMQSSRQLYIGAICHTNGFYSNGDGGESWYIVSDGGTANGMDVLALYGNLVAYCNKPTDVNAIGARRGSDISSCLVRAIENTTPTNSKVYIHAGEYYIHNTIDKATDICISACDGDVIFRGNNRPMFYIRGKKFYNQLHIIRGYNEQFINGTFYFYGTSAFQSENNVAIIIGYDAQVIMPYDLVNYTCRWSISNCVFEEFSTAVKCIYIDNFITRFNRCSFERNMCGIAHAKTSNGLRNNSGEQMLHVDCIFGNCGAGVVNDVESTFDSFSNCSFDFNGTPYKANSYTKACFTACHFEGNGSAVLENHESDRASLCTAPNAVNCALNYNGGTLLYNGAGKAKPLNIPIVDNKIGNVITGELTIIRDATDIPFDVMLECYAPRITLKNETYATLLLPYHSNLFTFPYDAADTFTNGTYRNVRITNADETQTTIRKVFDETINAYVLEFVGDNIAVHFYYDLPPFTDISKYRYYGVPSINGALSTPEVITYKEGNIQARNGCYWWANVSTHESGYAFRLSCADLYLNNPSNVNYDSIAVHCLINGQSGLRVHMPYLIGDK